MWRQLFYFPQKILNSQHAESQLLCVIDQFSIGLADVNIIRDWLVFQLRLADVNFQVYEKFITLVTELKDLVQSGKSFKIRIN